VTEPLADGGQIHSCLQKRHGRAVAQAVGVQFLSRKGGVSRRCVLQVLGQEIPDTEPRERLPSKVVEQFHFGVLVNLPFGAVGTQKPCGLGPQRTKAFFSPLAEEANLKWLGKLQVTGAEIQDFLNTGTGIEHGSQQRVIASALGTRTINRSKNGLDLLVFEILHGTGSSPLKGNAYDPLAVFKTIRMPRSQISEKGVDSRKTHIACGCTIAAPSLQVERNETTR
jgi:hypothetical protein